MSKDLKPHELLLQIGAFFDDRPEQDSNVQAQNVIDINSRVLRQQTERFKKFKGFETLNLDHEDILITACAWYQFVVNRDSRIDPLELLSKIFSDPSVSLNMLDRVLRLLQRKVFYSEKKEIKDQRHVTGDKTPRVHFHKFVLLENDICIHRSFIRLMLNEYDNVTVQKDEPYHSNKEFLTDWFAYVDKLSEFSSWDFSDRRDDVLLDEFVANDLLKALEWKEHIDNRLSATEQIFPLMDIVDEYRLDENETVILVYLAKEDMGMGIGVTS